MCSLIFENVMADGFDRQEMLVHRTKPQKHFNFLNESVAQYLTLKPGPLTHSGSLLPALFYFCVYSMFMTAAIGVNCEDFSSFNDDFLFFLLDTSGVSVCFSSFGQAHT